VAKLSRHLAGKESGLPHPARLFDRVLVQTLVVNIEIPLACWSAKEIATGFGEPAVLAGSLPELGE
jgi:hypothetical protein